MKRRAVLVAAAVAATPGARADVVNLKRPAIDELRELLSRQAAQWTAGDIDGFCAHYAEDCVFLSPSGVTKGRAAVLARYKKKYVEDKAGMGALSLEVLHAAVSDTLASIALTWTLTWPDKPKATGSSLVAFERLKGGWRIVHDASM